MAKKRDLLSVTELSTEEINDILDLGKSVKKDRAKYQDAFVTLLEILDDREGSVGLSQAYAVRENAAVVVKNLVDGRFGAVLLEGRKRAPDASVRKRDSPEVIRRAESMTAS